MYLCQLLCVQKGCVCPITCTYLHWEKQLINNPADSGSIDRKGIRGSLWFCPVPFHVGTCEPSPLTIDGHMLQCRVGNPSLAAAFIFFPRLWFSSSSGIRSTGAIRCLPQSRVTSSHPSRLSCKHNVWFSGLSVPALNLHLCLLGRELPRGHRAQHSSAADLFSQGENSV